MKHDEGLRGRYSRSRARAFKSSVYLKQNLEPQSAKPRFEALSRSFEENLRLNTLVRRRCVLKSPWAYSNSAFTRPQWRKP